MSNLICLTFDDVDTADHFLNELRGLEKEHVLDFEEACVVVRDPDGKVHIKQSVNLVVVGATRGASLGILMGTLVGLLFMNPLAGLLGGGLLGAWSGALKGRFVDYGLNDAFIKSLGDSIKPGSSALFFLLHDSTEEKVLPRLPQYEAKVLMTTLSEEQEEKLKAALSEVARPAAVLREA